MKCSCVYVILSVGKILDRIDTERVSSMKNMNQHKFGIWKVPLICLLAGILYYPLRYVTIMIFKDAGLSMNPIGLLINIVYFLLVLFLGGSRFLKNMTQKEIFHSAAVVSLYGIVLSLIQLITRSTTGSAAIVFADLNLPFNWAITPSLEAFVRHEFHANMNWIGYLENLEPFLFVLFGKRQKTVNTPDREN